MQLKCQNLVVIILLNIFFACNSNTNDGKYVNEFVAQIPEGYSEAVGVATQMGFILDHKMIGFDDLFVFKYKKRWIGINNLFKSRAKRSTKVKFIEQQIARKRVKRAPMAISSSTRFSDPLYPSQWYLMRSQNNPKDVDMNVIEAWNLGYSGKGIVVSILDDGIDHRHPDLIDNYDPMASYDINSGDNDPMANYLNSDNKHGTRCAGEVAAKANNTVCGVGVAFNSKIGAVRMLDGEVTDRVEAEALSLRQQHIDIYSGSWGPDDSGQKVEGPARLAKAAFEKGVKYGRNGLGNIYVWASGNGGRNGDSCACDGYASSIYTLSVSSVSEWNRKPYYLEGCASTLITTYSSGEMSEHKIVTTDTNFNCATDHTGTSASAPLAAGIIALLLEANRKLTWRDVQYITVVTANTSPFTDASFVINGANRRVSNLYGFGLLDTGKIVRLGRLWLSLPPQNICTTNSKVLNRYLKGVFVERVPLYVNGCSGNAMVNYIEHVVLYINVEYTRRGDLQIYLVSPAGTRCEILPFRRLDSHSGSATFDKWPLMSVQFWGEHCVGQWILEIKNVGERSATMGGILVSFSLKIFGTDKWPMRLRAPSERENDNWFQQFERYVVKSSKEAIDANNTFFRGHPDTSNGAFKRANIECHNQCLNNTCHGWGPQHCISCKVYKTYNGICVQDCPPGMYLNTSDSVCRLCHFSCDECFGDSKYNCSRCHVGDSFDENRKQCQISVNGCSKGLYKDISTCRHCVDNCSICTSYTQCSQCKYGFVLTLNSQCKRHCDLGSYADSRGRCRVCHTDCLSCVSGEDDECISCKHGSLLLPISNEHVYGRCISDCFPGYFTNNTADICYRCHHTCKTCTGPSSGSCTGCIPPLVLSESRHTCTDPVSYNCKPTEFMSSIGRCDPCPNRCMTCAEGRCTSCHSYGRFMFNNSCIELCPMDHFPVSKNNVCVSCRTFCDSCNPEIALLTSCLCSPTLRNCSIRCNTGEFWNGASKSCQRCHSSCAKCNGGTPMDCSQCTKSDYFLSSGVCVKYCPPGQHSYAEGERKLCIPCHTSCKNLSCSSETGKCYSCPHGHKLSPDGLCERIITCPMSYYWQTNETACKFCQPSCRSCSLFGACSSCPRDYCLDVRYGACHPCCSVASSIKGCHKCHVGREFCDLFDHSAPSSQLLIFRYPVSVIGTILLCILLLFVCIMLVFFRREDGLPLLTSGSETQSSVQYTKLQDSDSEDLSDTDSVLFRYPKGPGQMLPTALYPVRVDTSGCETCVEDTVLLLDRDMSHVKVNGATEVA